MSSANSYSAQGAILTIGTAGAAKTITAITKANPAVLTSTAHGLVDGDVVKISSVAGMTEINGKVGVVVVLTANTFELRGVDSTNFTTYTSGGSATLTAARLGNWKTWSGFDGQASDLDATDLDSTAMEYRMGLQDNGQLTLGLQINDTDDGQQALRGSLASAGPTSKVVITFKNGKTRTFQAYCKQFSEQGGVNQIIEGSAVLRISGSVTRG